uniref:NAD(P)(+)--arginine ADP-ribosyltransferase n=1 Tax=Oryctolagus cuniculus TaxID=9986 RepID=A0A5F9DRD0_RABIT
MGVPGILALYTLGVASIRRVGRGSRQECPESGGSEEAWASWEGPHRKEREQQQERRARGPTRLPPFPAGFRDEHEMALLAYTDNSPLYREFNTAVRQGGRSRAHYCQHFSFKTLHFLLTEALQLLGRAQRMPRCRQVFRGVKGLRFRTSGPGTTVRLGGFASSSLKKDVAQKFGEDTFFSIRTCLGIPIQNYSVFPGQAEVLIPPFETFQVINTSRAEQGPVHIYLSSLGKHSSYNCEYVKGEEDTPVRSAASPIPKNLANHPRPCIHVTLTEAQNPNQVSRTSHGHQPLRPSQLQG